MTGLPWLLLALTLGADAKRGESLYVARCGACHSLGENGAGPSHARLWGRRAGTQPGFDYSDALRASNLVWNEKTLEQWLSNPNALVPGNKMVVQLANDPLDRADLIVFLKQATAGARRPRARPESLRSAHPSPRSPRSSAD